MTILSALVSLFGCKKPPPALTVTDLAFPVLLVTEKQSVKLCEAAEDLTNLHSNYLDLSRGERRFVIDSSFRIVEVLNLRSAKSSYLRMITGPGRMAVLFEMNSVAGGIDEARRLMTECGYLSVDTERSEQARQTIQKAGTMAEMLDALRAEQ